MRLLLLAGIMALISGCALGHVIAPEQPPVGLQPALQEGHYVAAQPPIIESYRRIWPFRYVKWQSVADRTFTSFSICPFGFPGVDKKGNEIKAHCLQMYWGIKADGTESMKLQEKDATLWDWVFTPSEQAAFRWREISPPSQYNMGGS